MLEAIEGLRTFTVEEYHRMAEAEVFAPGEHVELIRGVIREMSPKGKRHMVAVALAVQLFVRRLAGRATALFQDPLILGRLHSEPEPDVVVVPIPDPRDLDTERLEPVLVIEIADSSLRFDRKVKGPLYAQAGVPDYWIVNLVNDVLEVHRDPGSGGYSTRLVLKPGERIAPLAFPDLEIDVKDLIP